MRKTTGHLSMQAIATVILGRWLSWVADAAASVACSLRLQPSTT